MSTQQFAITVILFILGFGIFFAFLLSVQGNITGASDPIQTQTLIIETIAKLEEEIRHETRKHGKLYLELEKEIGLSKEGIRNEIAETEAKLASLLSRQSKMNYELARLTNPELFKSMNQLARQVQEVEKIEEQVNNAKSIIKNIDDEIGEVYDQFSRQGRTDNLTEELAKLQNQRRKFSDALDLLNNDLGEKRRLVKQLTDKIERGKDFLGTGFSRNLQCIKRIGKKGGLIGIIGIGAYLLTSVDPAAAAIEEISPDPDITPAAPSYFTIEEEKALEKVDKELEQIFNNGK